MNNLVIGMGEVGRALASILRAPTHDPMLKKTSRGQFHVLHVCIPYTKDFVSIVRAYEKEFLSTLTVVHSTVPVGTCATLEAVHSPVRGLHPHLELGIKTFVKYFGGPQAMKAANIFE
jgi:hypothetical protein